MCEKVYKCFKIDIKKGMKTLYSEVFGCGRISFEKLNVLLSGKIIERGDDILCLKHSGKSRLYKLIKEFWILISGNRKDFSYNGFVVNVNLLYKTNARYGKGFVSLQKILV